MSLILPVVNAPVRLPEKFVEELERYDPTLFVLWDAPRARWCIWQCTEHGISSAHDESCKRSYVWLLQNLDKSYMEPNYKVLEKLASIDLRRQGFGPEDAAKFLGGIKEKRDAATAEKERKAKEAVHGAAMDGKLQLTKARNLISQHDMRPNK